MSQPIKLPVFIAIIAAAVLVSVLIGYKVVATSNPPERTDAAHLQVIASMEAARAARAARGESGKGLPPSHP